MDARTRAASRALLWLAICALSLPAVAAHLPIQRFGTRQGLPRDSVTCMVGSPGGPMWFCSTEGLARFDGRNFRIFGPEDGLPSRVVLQMSPSRHGGYWVITDGGVCLITARARVGEPCRVFTGSQPDDWRTFGAVAEAENGDVWVASENRLYQADLAHYTLTPAGFESGTDAAVNALAEGERGTLLIGTDRGLYERSQTGAIRELTAGMKGAMGIGSVFRLSSGDVWLSTASGLFRLRFRGKERAPEFRGGWLPDRENPRQFLLRRDGTLWMVALRAVLQLDLDTDGNARVARRITAAEGLPAVNLSMLAEDAAGNLWVATEGQGVARIAESGFALYGESNGLGLPRMAALLEDRAGNFLVMTSFDGKHDLYVRAGDRFEPVSIPAREIPGGEAHTDGVNQVMLQSRDGEWWFASGVGILRFGASTVQALPQAPLLHQYKPGQGLDCTAAERVYESEAGDIWASCTGPVPHPARLDRARNEFRAFGERDGWRRDTTPRVFREAPQGDIWVGTEKGVVRFHGDRFVPVTLDPQADQSIIWDLLVDRQERLWIATNGSGVYRCDDPASERPRFVQYDLRAGLSSVRVRGLTQDKAGYIYAASVRGVDRIDPAAPVASRRVRHFGPQDGLPESEMNVALATRDEHLWFGTMFGLAEFNPSQVRPDSPPRVYFTRVLVRGDEVPFAWDGANKLALELSPERNQVQIEFADGTNPTGNLRFQYRMAGGDWGAPSEESRVNYAALPYGHLRFEVQAVGADGQTYGSPAAIELDVAAPIWRRWWFLLLAGIGGAALAVTAYRYRVDHLLAIERLRVRIATDLHDDIGSNLSQIAIMTELARRSPERGLPEVIASIARETVEQMSDIVWAVNPKYDRLDALMGRMRRYAEETLGGVDIELKFEPSELPERLTIPVEARRALYLVFKEAISNAARHSRGTRVTVRFELADGTLRMTVTDNGQGFDLTSHRTGEGIASISARLRNLGGNATWTTAPGEGTRLDVLLPRKRHYWN